jgi:exodeoxyribonuclease V alpha subunit
MVLGEQPAPPLVTAEVTITSVHSSAHGSMVLIGRDEDGSLQRAIARAHVLPREPAVGETWRLTGTDQDHALFGQQLHTQIALPLVPKGKAIIRYLATEQRFVGVGWATADRLWSAFGEELFHIIRSRDLSRLAAIVGPEKALSIIDGFGSLAEEVDIFQWFDRYGISPRTAGAAARLWGREAIDRIKVDPYSLRLLEPWSEADARALRLGLLPDDERRLVAAVEEALAIRFRLGHMAAEATTVKQLVSRLTAPWKGKPDAALELALRHGRVVSIGDTLVQSRACRFMESEIERLLRERLQRSNRDIDPAVVLRAIKYVEKESGYQLTKRQREAVFMATSSHVSVVTGGAGTGKTTVLKAIQAAFEEHRATLPSPDGCDLQYLQTALAGRAVRRISEATGKEAITIARLIHQIEDAGRRLERGLIIFDEASMLDTPSIYRILSQIPVEMDLLFAGDPAQLPPIGPGLLFQSTVDSDAIPRVDLDVIHRQEDSTGIPGAGALIRGGVTPPFKCFDPKDPLSPGVFLIPADTDEIATKTLATFRAMAGSVPKKGHMRRLHELDIQILTQTKKGPAGSKALSRQIEAEYTYQQMQIADWGLRVGSKILWLKNDYQKSPIRDSGGNVIIDSKSGKPVCAGFMNGSIGMIQRPHDDGAWVLFDDGAEDTISAIDLEKLSYGWAISVHKAQGSAFHRVIIPIVRSKLLDRTLIYTALTRAVETVILIGDLTIIDEIIRQPPRSLSRTTGLDWGGLLEKG